MKLNRPVKLLLICVFILPGVVRAQASRDSMFEVNNLTPFINPGKNWSVVGDVVFNPAKDGNFQKVPGNGILLAEPANTENRLTTRENFGDVDMEFDFLSDRKSSAVLLMQGRYALNLSDSWAEHGLSFNSMGGIAPQNALDKSGFSGAAPLMNVAKAPGLWQHVRLRFRAPQFENSGKTANALFEEVYINSGLVQQNMLLQAPSPGSLPAGEANVGPISFYNNNGMLAIKNLKIRKLAPQTPAARTTARRFNRVTNPITITPEGSNYLLRSFINIGKVKKTHVISVGSPGQVNYSYDLKQGALLQVWHGPFVDVTEMWHERGEPQLAKPLGSVIGLSENPTLAVLNDANASWPDSVRFDDFKILGYTLDKQRNPMFEYETGGYHVQDKIAFGNENRRLTRELNVKSAPGNLYCRLAQGASISSIGNGWYVVNDKSYYLQMDEKLKPVTRKTSRGVELVVPVINGQPLSYSLIW